MIKWQNRTVVTGARLIGETVERLEIRVEFVGSVFDRCSFRKITTDGAFWKANNTWRDCHFDEVEMKDLVAPANRFHRCTFRNSTLRQFVACDTVFEDCRFTDVAFETMVARQNSMKGKPFAAIPLESLTFRNCSFESPRFDACRFQHVSFETCVVHDPQVSECSFDGVLGSPAWWQGLPSFDPFIAFLDAVLAGIDLELGRQSVAWSRMAEYAQSYKCGETTSKDYSACLFEDVPEIELDQLDDLLDGLEARYRI